MADQRLLRIQGATYSYPNSPAPALRDLDLEIAAGEFVVVAGRSGSGKSTLLRAASGLVPHFHGGEFRGDVEIDGRSTRDVGPAELASSVGFVAQEPETQVVSTTVGAELGLPLELRGREPGQSARAVEEVALALAIEPLLERTTDALSGGELQRVAIAAALVTRPPLLLLDEPTSQLDPVAGDELLSLLRRLNDEWGVTILLGEHRLERCLAGADRIVALEGGELVYDGDPERFGRFACERAPWLRTPASRLFELAGLPDRPVSVKAARAALPHLPETGPTAADGNGPPRVDPGARPDALVAAGLRVELDAGLARREVLHGVDLRVGAGETVTVIGPNGAGKSTLLRAAAGIVKPAAGSIEAAGGCALLTQRPDDFFVHERVSEELPGLDGEVALAAAGLQIDTDRDPRDLSGGERQRLALAIAFAGRGAGGHGPGLVCLDEPTRGLDPERKGELARWLGELAATGCGVVVATHDVELAAAISDRVVLLARGEVLAEAPAEELLAGGWYFTTETARITSGRAITPEAGAALLARSALRLAGGEGR